MINFEFDKIKPLCASFGLELNTEICERLNGYGNLLIEWNEKINLTAITEPEEILYKHFYDCLLFLKHIDIKNQGSLIDVGTGAGFPGMVLKIARPDISLTLLDGLNKRLVFLQEVLRDLGLEAKTVHLRAEEAGKKAEYREKFDIATARAVAALPVLSEYCLPLVKKGGMFVAMKGQNADEEAKAAQRAISVLGGERSKIICETLTGNEQRSFIITKKISQTPPKYPRHSGKIAKSAI